MISIDQSGERNLDVGDTCRPRFFQLLIRQSLQTAENAYRRSYPQSLWDARFTLVRSIYAKAVYGNEEGG